MTLNKILNSTKMKTVLKKNKILTCIINKNKEKCYKRITRGIKNSSQMVSINGYNVIIIKKLLTIITITIDLFTDTAAILN